ncbi:MAG: sulfatase-like hydrolase/transferase [Planctomycetes bacterium]|jgi:choline-sulfatase|nr:sulfatase-like hydrolase/transferase [Planctomycetota bacterium]
MAAEPGKPHLLLMLASQLRCDVIGAFAAPQSFTPKLDLLARHASVFLRHFTPCPLGGPARASLYTGLPPRRHGAIIQGHDPSLATVGPDVPVLHRRLLDAGYRVVHVGLLNVPAKPDLRRRAPEAEYLGPPGLAEHLQALADRGLIYGDLDTLRDPVLEHVAGRAVVLGGVSPRTLVFPLKEELFYDRVIADEAAHTIVRHADRRDPRPLALLCHFHLPHPPLWAPQHHAELVEPGDVKLPTTTGKWYAGTSPLQLANLCGQLGARVTVEQWRTAWAMYHGMVHLLDDCVGRVLAAADRAAMLDEAVVVFTADHGEMLGDHRLWGKMCCYDPAVRVPLIIKPPGGFKAAPHRHFWELTTHADLHATLLAYAGIEADEDDDEAFAAHPLHGAAAGRTPPPGRELVFATFDGHAGIGCRQRMARSRTHKLIHNIGHGPELYDLVEDPRETRSLIDSAEHLPIQRALADQLMAWMDEQQDDAPRL